MSKRYMYASLIGMVILLSASPLFAQPPDTLWTKTYGGAMEDTAYSVCPTSDGGYIIAGVTNSMGAGDWDGYLVKTDSAGNVEWEQTYGTARANGFYDVLETSDGEYIASGWTTTLFPFSNTDFWLIRVDSSGVTVWEQIYGGEDHDTGFTMVPALDGNYLVVGYTWSFGTGGSADAWVLKFDPATGDIPWLLGKKYDPGRPEYSGELFFSGCQTSDESYLFVGCSGITPPENWDVYVVKTDSAGEVIWDQLYEWGSFDRGHSACQTPDGGYLVIGTANPTGHSDVLILKLDEAGDTVWTKFYGGEGDDKGYGICPSGDSMYLISARTSSFGAGGYDLWVLAIDTLGDTLCTQTYGAEADEWCYFPKMNPNGNFMLPGFTSSWGEGGADFWLLEYGYEKEPGVAEQLIESPIRITTTINRLAYDLPGQASLTLYSADGRRVLTETIQGQGTWTPSSQPSSLPSGVYFARVTTEGYSARTKVVVLR
ncbi:hypothetical protein CEE36_00585 [candidate division TA06 bacterium B3_TA06]|uniref:Secretion system C-terminal sorting domain-containing protein n=1 Tax=candidate division TA06 bacterium B3_TA06 TaxID=2012487 RepID=A0A532VAS7_UNCT6|nr:MAG: hypothetical protein CEE36_00585 [candidate division TA06 bacterium B3_TA06]